MPRLVSVLISVLLLATADGFTQAARPSINTICADYIAAWKQFYPSRAFSIGCHAAIFSSDDLSPAAIERWIGLNRATLDELNRRLPSLSLDDRIDARLLRIQTRSELERWQQELPQRSSVSLYSGAIEAALDNLIDSDLLLPGEKLRLIRDRLSAVRALVASARSQLTGALRDKAEGLESLEKSAAIAEQDLVRVLEQWLSGAKLEQLRAECGRTAEAIRALIADLEAVPAADHPGILGREVFTRKLAIALDSELSPEALEAMALEEIFAVREQMVQAAADYLDSDEHADADTGLDLLAQALHDMESDYPQSRQEYLALWQDLTRRAERFVREARIVTLPESSTLSIKLAPESAGEMARIGWVSPAPVFAPNPWTTIYLPNIADDSPQAERRAFWRSFNNYFTRFIVIHELYPGHYVQNRINRENPHTVRVLFPYPLYSEGWATLCEKVALDAGWESDSPLTRLAHLRKRLENANRAYTSVQVHCRGWSQEQVMEFSTNTALLAPQFAQSLWYRLLRSPLRITTYFLGNRELLHLLEAEQARQGESFQLQVFMDTVLRAGPIPLDELPAVFL